ncbi:hypothetical protein I549_0617 [Mycobacterium avium subsp. avium 2285 (R)]|nr:hypothetical protein I549_0617 [Mycobacterium avium subsp. avium 2285 (R)]
MAVPDAVDFPRAEQATLDTRGAEDFRVPLRGREAGAEQRRGGLGCGTERRDGWHLRTARSRLDRTDMFHVKHPLVGACTFNVRTAATRQRTTLL